MAFSQGQRLERRRKHQFPIYLRAANAYFPDFKHCFCHSSEPVVSHRWSGLAQASPQEHPSAPNLNLARCQQPGLVFLEAVRIEAKHTQRCMVWFRALSRLAPTRRSYTRRAVQYVAARHGSWAILRRRNTARTHTTIARAVWATNALGVDRSQSNAWRSHRPIATTRADACSSKEPNMRKTKRRAESCIGASTN